MSGEHIVLNNTFLQVSGTVGVGDTTLNFTAGHGVRIPTIASPGFMFGTLIRVSTGELERVKITAHTAAADSCTVVRGVDGTSALAFTSSDVEMSMRVGRADFDQVPRLGLSENAAVAAGSVNAAIATIANSGLQDLPDNFMMTLIGATPNTSDVPTFNLTLGSVAVGAKTIVKGNQMPLASGDLSPVSVLLYRTSWDQWVLTNPLYGEVQAGDFISSVRTETSRTGYLKPDGSTAAVATTLALFNAITRTATVTITLASPGVVTWAAHGFDWYEELTLETTGTLPTGLAILTKYYVVPVDANSFELSLTPGGVSINTSTTQNGVHTARHYPHGAGDGSTTFNIPDASSRSRVASGQGSLSVSVDSNNVSATNETFTVPEMGWQTGMKVQLTTSAADLPAPLAIATDYWVIRVNANEISFATTLANAQNKVNILLSDVGTGVHTVTHEYTDRSLGYVSGEESHAMGNLELLAHTHTQELSTGADNLTVGGSFQSTTNSQTSSTGGNNAMNNMSPFIVENLWVKT